MCKLLSFHLYAHVKTQVPHQPHISVDGVLVLVCVFVFSFKCCFLFWFPKSLECNLAKPIFIIFIFIFWHFCYKVTRLIPEAHGTTCNQGIERISGTQHSQILRVPFRTEKGVLRHWVSRFDVWPYLERFAEVKTNDLSRLKFIISSFVFLQCVCKYPF